MAKYSNLLLVLHSHTTCGWTESVLSCETLGPTLLLCAIYMAANPQRIAGDVMECDGVHVEIYVRDQKSTKTST